MQQNTKIIGLIVGAVVIMGGAYFLLQTPNPVYVDPMLTATTTEMMTEQESLEATTTETAEVPTATATIAIKAETVPTTTESKPVSTKPTTPTPTPVPTPTPTPTPVPTTPPPVVSAGITMKVVATHNDANSCWSAIDGKVYDLTTYIPRHPGGKGEILAICGKDGSSLFNGQHGGDAKPERILAGFYINVLAN